MDDLKTQTATNSPFVCPDVAHLRLINQHLASPVFERAADVVEWMGAVQAQDFGAAKWALGLRMKNASDSQIEQAFNDGAILRTHVMRPTWHFVTPKDIRWMLALTAPRVRLVSKYQFNKLELDSGALNRTADLIVKEIADKGHRTRDELREVLDADGIQTRLPLRMIYILFHAELEGLICSGPRRGKQFTYALVDERVPPVKPLSREESLAKLAERFFSSHGPATVQDMAKWSGLTVGEAKEGIESIKSKFLYDRFFTRPCWYLPQKGIGSDIRATHLLPIYDEYTIGYKFHTPVFDSVNYSKLIFQNPLAVDGIVSGTWSKTETRQSAHIKVKSFGSLSVEQIRAVDESLARYSAFLGKSMSIEWVNNGSA